jgi:hypothetical protein
MPASQMEEFAALWQNRAGTPCGGGFGWGYSEKVPAAAGNNASNQRIWSLNSNCLQEAGEGLGVAEAQCKSLRGVVCIGVFGAQKHVDSFK